MAERTNSEAVAHGALDLGGSELAGVRTGSIAVSAVSLTLAIAALLEVGRRPRRA